MSKKLLVWLLTLCMMLSLAVVAVYAEEAAAPAAREQVSTPVQAAWGSSKETLTHEGTLDDAIAAAKGVAEPIYIMLLDDAYPIQGNDSVANINKGVYRYILNGHKFTLDLNGHDLSPNSTRTQYIYDESGSGAVVTITDSVGSGTVTGTTEHGIILRKGTLTFEAGTFVAKATSAKGNFWLLGGNLVLKDGTFGVSADAENVNVSATPIIAYSSGTVNMSELSANVAKTFSLKMEGDVAATNVTLPTGLYLFSTGDLSPATLVNGSAYTVGEGYAVTLSSTDAENSVLTGAGGYKPNGSATVVANSTSSTLAFAGWYENDVPVCDEPTYTFTVSSARNLVAKFEEALPVQITANATEGGKAAGTGEYAVHGFATLTATPDFNYQFVNWTKDGVPVSTDMSYTVEVSEAATYVANFVLYAPEEGAEVAYRTKDLVWHSGSFHETVSMLKAANTIEYIRLLTSNIELPKDDTYRYELVSADCTFDLNGHTLKSLHNYIFNGLSGGSAGDVKITFVGNGGSMMNDNSYAPIFGRPRTVFTVNGGTYKGPYGIFSNGGSTYITSGTFESWQYSSLKRGNGAVGVWAGYVKLGDANYQPGDIVLVDGKGTFAMRGGVLDVSALGDEMQGKTIYKETVDKAISVTTSYNSAVVDQIVLPANFAVYDVNGQKVDSITAVGTYTIRKSVSLNVSSADETLGKVTVTGVAALGEEVTVSARPNTYEYAFKEWQMNDVKVEGAGADYTFTLTGDCALVAVFEEATIPADADVAYYVNGGEWKFGSIVLGKTSGVWTDLAASTGADVTKIVLLKSVDVARVNQGATVQYKFTIDLNGNTITSREWTNVGTKEAPVYEERPDLNVMGNRWMDLTGAARVVVTDSKTGGAIVGSSHGAFIVRSGAELTLTGGTLSGTTRGVSVWGGKFTMSGGTAQAGNGYSVEAESAAGTVILSGGTFTNTKGAIHHSIDGVNYDFSGFLTGLNGLTFIPKSDAAIEVVDSFSDTSSASAQLILPVGYALYDANGVKIEGETLIAAGTACTILVDEVAKIGDTPYGTLDAALTAASANGATVTLARDITAGVVSIPAGVTLDLGNCALEAESVDGTTGGYIVAGENGTLKVSGSFLLDSANPQIPVYNGEAYVFTKPTFKHMTPVVSADGNSFTWKFRPYMSTAAEALFASGAAMEDAKLQVRLTSDKLSKKYVILEFGSETYNVIKNVYADSNLAFVLTVNGIAGLDDLTAQVQIVSESGVITVGKVYDIAAGAAPAPAATYGVVANKSSVAVGQEIEVSVKIPAIDELLSGVTIAVEFDNTAFEVIGFNPKGFVDVTKEYSAPAVANSEGKFSVTYASGSNIIDFTEGYELTATLCVKDTAAAGDATFTIVTDGSEKTLTIESTDDLGKPISRIPDLDNTSVTVTVAP